MLCVNQLSGFGGASNKDPDFSSVVLLLHLDGADAATSTSDASESGHAITFNGNTELDTAQEKFGGSSLRLPGSAGDFISTPDSADWDFDAGDFTIEFFIRLSTVASSQCFISQEQDLNNRWRFQFDNTVGAAFTALLGGVLQVDFSQGATTGWSADTWYHVAVTRDGNDFDIYRDGTSIASVTDSSDMPNVAAALRIGQNAAGSTLPVQGWMDEVRITKGVARYTGSFSAPTSPFPS